jgi:catechol 2,3-dioxygenase-like lactoylglutathione lyase family enzyme
MVKNFDHLTIVVRDVERAKTFFALLGFKEAISVVISGEPFSSYMGVPGIKADHVTLVLDHVTPRTEIQLLHYQNPAPLPDPHIRDLHKIGMNHICFAVDDIEAEVCEIESKRLQDPQRDHGLPFPQARVHRRPRRRHGRGSAMALSDQFRSS